MQIKYLKPVISIIVLAVIVIVIINSLVETAPPPPPRPPENNFVKNIQADIDNLSLLPDNQFCKATFKSIAYRINQDYTNQNYGKSEYANFTWKESLMKNLYAAYTGKFIKQAFFVFNHPFWEKSDLNFIREEVKGLKNSTYLEGGSIFSDKFTEINSIFDKYDSITAFISDCKGFSFMDMSLTAVFPVSDVQNNLLKATAYDYNTGNSYVNNCSRLHIELKSVPEILFKSHVEYIDALLAHHKFDYQGLSNFTQYRNDIFLPLDSILDGLENMQSVYGVPNFQSQYNRLRSLLDSNSRDAYLYFN